MQPNHRRPTLRFYHTRNVIQLGLHCVLGAFAIAAPTPAPAEESPTRIELHTTGKQPTAETRVSFSIPFPPGELVDPALVRVLDGKGSEVPASVETILRWHFKDGSVRAVRVQVQAGSTARAPLKFSVGTKREASLKPTPYSEGLVEAEHGLRMPAMLATLDPRWLSRSLIAGPQQPVEAGNAYDHYFNIQFKWARPLPTNDSTAWLFDRPSTLFKQYVRSGQIDHLYAAVESYRFYMAHLVREGRCAGGWQFGKANPCDAKYVYIEPILLAVGLTGDDSLHDDKLLSHMAEIWRTGGWSGISGPYLRVDQPFTERHAGLGLLSIVSAYELTGKVEYRKSIVDRIRWLDDHQRNNPDGLGNDGSWRHSWQRHEGSDYDPKTDIRGASPWMSENIIDGLWHAWLVEPNPSIPDMIAGFGWYMEKHGWIDAATRAQHDWTTECAVPKGQGQIAWYWSSAQTDIDSMIELQDSEGWFSDSHNVQLMLAVAAARYFEPDSKRRATLSARLNDVAASSYHPNCAKQSATARRFNWNNRGAGVVQWFLKPTNEVWNGLRGH